MSVHEIVSYKLKNEYIVTEAFKKEIRILENIFFEDEHKFLSGTRLPKKIKDNIDKLWWSLPCSKIQHGFKTYAMVEHELEDLKKDPICGKNSNKIPWIKIYMMSWLCYLPLIASIDFLYAQLTCARTSHNLLITNAYQRKVEGRSLNELPEITSIFGFSLPELERLINFARSKDFDPRIK